MDQDRRGVGRSLRVERRGPGLGLQRILQARVANDRGRPGDFRSSVGTERSGCRRMVPGTSAGARAACQPATAARTVAAAIACLFVIAGGSRGIGKAIALEAARAGYAVLLTYVRNKEAARDVVEEIRTRGGEAWAVQADTSRDADIQHLFAECDRLGGLDVFVYNAGITGQPSTLL